ncbi:MAG: polyprenyl diphosphate synthase [Helicobacter sp.]|nr:polyprenyl diphosphate synthase [Helicobacteraceae bacterium]MDY3112749.1 polyprenyl diphosphate synthase [Helicobacter sp.]
MNIAIIPDGNGRWAKNRLKPRSFGHKAGAKKIEEITESCIKLGVKSLSVYAFSTENWRRPKKEVDFLMQLLSEYLESKIALYLENNIIFKAIGDLSIFKQDLRDKIKELESKTIKNCNGLTQILALNYGAKDELRRAFNKIAKDSSDIKESDIQSALDFKSDIDILIRTGGEKRLSNFLLWQAAYAELFFSDTLWPDFSTNELESIILEFKKRERRFGGL